jgi:hypothetical protein
VLIGVFFFFVFIVARFGAVSAASAVRMPSTSAFLTFSLLHQLLASSAFDVGGQIPNKNKERENERMKERKKNKTERRREKR